MSLRIRKVLGYALTDVVPADQRINWDSPLLDLVGVKPTFGDFMHHLEAAGPFEDPELEDVDMVRAGIGNQLSYRLGSCVVHSFDYGLPSVMALVPPSYASTWIQDDNIFDYVEAHLGGEADTSPALHDVPGIDPYDGRWMDKATGLELNYNYVRGYRRALALNSDVEQHDIAARRISFAGRPRPEEPLFADAAIAAERLTRLVPAEIRELALLGNLFTDQGTWTSLRPILYTYWS
ncbi:hypothetical protein Achl_4362 (plasmid) [Pseudarthrobacter chlorophenolicus A6]|uniref:Uncharacterized protein n=1 Tax=Pseudarthrobacter chlorophenolicus (strain ATCC 700700 / DSM 12829 / CIP 107037 / JCM 12360 / KCTC 9906 / NCIMB 13794 / A6) TaxID=452863 RepID=B8HIR6_PSECP|nr:hypothetical protein [Pseudarthrobacter chlorophenolicus]ACL42313.1 hypothetical protein Achl_4362 [Pseudarthrobacter chlorophenolicus A6]SDQ16356.1 hypothetical protein SAMN04489738_0419 [Pseudarthrobacter chlorophenolicus]